MGEVSPVVDPPHAIIVGAGPNLPPAPPPPPPGFLHARCWGIPPLAAASPFFNHVPLEEHGLRWIDPPAACAHPFDDGTAALLLRSTRETGETLGPDARAWRALFDPLVSPFHPPPPPTPR